ncbi:MAG TPA: sulfurtransferase TusA family protein [Gammaproteobacteria bacterium]|nr:sulfurtransferase TusA family protein [Gammaproteobacteria bacterium]
MSERRIIDARGSYCPGPLMELIAALKLLQVGDEVEILSTDQGTARDVPEWTAKVGHETVESGDKDGHWYVVVRKMK